jgi:hypothetical protein
MIVELQYKNSVQTIEGGFQSSGFSVILKPASRLLSTAPAAQLLLQDQEVAATQGHLNNPKYKGQ